MKQIEQLNKHIDNYFKTRKNKRYGRDAAEYEINWVARLVRSVKERDNKTFRIRHNYAFLVSKPRWREIFATEFDGRLADHELCDRLNTYIETILSPRTFNNRIGKGSSAAIKQVVEDMIRVSENFTKKAWIIKFDLKGFFPNADCNYINDLFKNVISEFIDDKLDSEYLNWLSTICINSDPAKHCELRTPVILWKKYIDKEKSLFGRPPGVGIPIGRLSSQTGMGMYINDDIKWINEECNIPLTVFVDDGVIIVDDEHKEYALGLFSLLRKRFLSKGVRMNEKKFYCQQINKGLEFLGYHIKPNRIHINNTTYSRAIKRIKQLNEKVDKIRYVDELMASVNSYTGLMKKFADYKRILRIRKLISVEFTNWVWWSEDKHCLLYLPGCSIKDRLNKKYNLKLKCHDNRTNN